MKWGIIIGNWVKWGTIGAFLEKKRVFYEKYCPKVCRYEKKTYLCIAFENESFGRLAQLVQSICLTSRGSAVRIRQRPLKCGNLV